MKVAKFKIVQDGCFAKILMNGEELHGVRQVSYSQSAGELPILNIDFVALDMEIDCACVPALPKIFEDFYEPIKPDGEPIGREKKW